MTDEQTDDDAESTVRCWLVERSFDQRNLVTLVYATPDGERYQQRELSAHALSQIDVTAAKAVPEGDLESVEDDDQRERYAAEVATMAEEHEPDEEL
ncbi:hypothetical protein SAMN06269185_2352 [Natronoarchaeum philippinense]|uniref:DUF7967 domain-containing protein n=1 Tax=Natronoarchaeum philippinense TaxID=558529 RepID=A0A285P4E5_NATPI|nr:hypothetical protein [Natronoarchaeum philippinense]SNZ15026.1 hypothetical protein SAMN06269185_2352 [Natronoarchaeum philippinense]